MKKFGKLLVSALLAIVMLFTLCMSAMAEIPNENQTATVTITNLTVDDSTPTVTLYQIIKATYDENIGFMGYVSAIPEASQSTYPITPDAPTFDEIEAIWKAVKAGTLTLASQTATVDGTTATADVKAGTWLAVVSGGGDTIYNPMVVSAYYADEDGNPLTGGETDATGLYELVGGTTVAKSSTPTVEKEVSGVESDNSASVGDVLTYTITPTMPSYPANATNKTFYAKDTMSTGLTLLADSIKVNGISVVDGVFTEDGKQIATLKVENNAFIVSFNYDNLAAAPVVTYSAVVNDTAVVGNVGNNNTVKLVYSTDPTTGNTWDPLTGGDEPTTGVGSDEDTVTVYTYQLAFEKEDDKKQPLGGAKFGVYSDETCTTLIDVVTTNSQGYAATSKVSAGTYYLKEIEAPKDFALNNQVYSIEASMSSATTTATVTNRTYTDTAPAENPQQVGWLLDGVFYAVKPNESAVAAYLASETVTSSVSTEVVSGAGTVLLSSPIPNTKLSELPSTGGVGTTLFIVGGVALMALAIALIAIKKRNAKN